MTDIGGENFAFNDFSSDEERPINIFQKIKNPKAKKNFKKLVGKSKILINFSKKKPNH